MFKRAIFILTAMVLANSTLGQDLDLFQATDSQNRTENNTRRPQRITAQNAEPAFTLVGTSRFGDKYYASLLSRSGEQVRVSWARGSIKEIDGYNGYGIANVGSRSVSIRVPSSEPCVDSEEKGVKCNGDMAVLTLSNAKPIAARRVPERNRENAGGSGDANATDQEPTAGDEPKAAGNTGALPLNPFSGELQQAPNLSPEEIVAREARRERREQNFRNFEIVRIPDDEIPEGMQRIRTPFGDHLEPVADGAEED